jgi:aminoglycoside phosphotransferase (APT) family kinase protein
VSHPHLTAEITASILAELGVDLPSAHVALEQREDRWLIRCPDARIVWIAGTERGCSVLDRERRLLRILDGSLPFAVPVVLAVTADGAADLRTLVPGEVDPWAVYHRVIGDDPFGSRLGRELGNALAALHALRVREAVESWLPHEPEWPISLGPIMEALQRVVDDRHIHAGAESVLDSYRSITRSLPRHERVLVHGDLGFHNLALSPETQTLSGIFDWAEACWSDHHLDFRHLLADADHQTLFEAAVSSYTTGGGRPIMRSRVLLYNAVWAISFLAYRDGVSPDIRWCGRTLAEDLAWTRRALRAIEVLD